MSIFPQATLHSTPFFDDRPPATDVSLLVIHNISLPPGQFNTNGIRQLFSGTLDATEHPFYQQIADLRVSAHCVIYRSGVIEQFVPFDKRAWHAGVSSFQGRNKCNDYGIGIEMEGTDTLPYTGQQYTSLLAVSRWLLNAFPLLSCGRIVGHNDIAPGRKTDPGPAFDWARYRKELFLE